jgi:hypothetical protein
MAQNKITKILQDPFYYESLAYGYNGILAALARRILGELGVSVPRWQNLMADFVTDARNGVPANQKDRTSMRGNLTKEFSRETMTWKVFIKFLRFLQAVRIVLVLRITWATGRTSEHESRPIDLGHRRPLAEFLKDVESPDEEDSDDLAEPDVPLGQQQPQPSPTNEDHQLELFAGLAPSTKD